MRRSCFLPVFLGLALLVAAVSTAAAEGKTVAIPKGTKVQKVEPGHFKLTTPDGVVFEITNYKKTGGNAAGPGAAGILGDCGIHDAKGKLIATGANGILKGAARAIIGDSGRALKDAPPTDYIKIDDEVTWLPATIQFPSLRIFDRTALLKLNPQPEPPLQRK